MKCMYERFICTCLPIYYSHKQERKDSRLYSKALDYLILVRLNHLQ